ncbi:hypothetical protein SteCoe_26587 [Stentor coeruleus]|uniref:Peptidase A1 domain-containing protein n=1 Tax=Stentor coeruleus TaxID=5963 RepID=A0A1R2BCI0_9CILI|nr:hypothetical protein SteCoe_26587 [Stentor coeruleus]
MAYLIFVLGLVASVPLKFVKQSELGKNIKMHDCDTVLDDSSGYLAATFYVGTPEVAVDMFLSLNNSAFSIPFDEKEGSSRYSMSTSSTLTNVKEGTLSNLKGFTGKDVVSFNDLTVKDQEIFITNYTDNYGVIGLDLDTDVVKKTFVHRLYSTSVISDAVFSVNLRDMEFKVGDYNAGNYEDNDFHSLSAKDGWTFKLSEVDFYGNLGGLSSSVKFDFTQELIWCDSSQLYLFESYIELFYGYKKKNGRYYASCNEEDIDDFLRLDFVIQNENIYIYPRSYINYSKGTCEFLISSESSDTWILGKPLFKEYLAFFDVDREDVYLYRFNDTSFFSSYTFYILLACSIITTAAVIATKYIKGRRNNNYGYMRIS